MKKCASCTKDLPEAALHCVFCGAKQPPAPAVQPGLAKTAFGYSNEMMNQLRGGPATDARSNTGEPPTVPLRMAPAPAVLPPHVQPTLAAPPSPPMAMAATLAAPPPLSPMPPRDHAPSQPPPLRSPFGSPSPSSGPQGMGVYAPQSAHAPQAGFGPPHRISQRFAHQGDVVEPWRHSLKHVMLVWGVLALVALAMPVSVDPLSFSWEALTEGGTAVKIAFLLFASVGVLGIAFALLPMPSVARGLLAALLGLTAIASPIAFGDLPEWQTLLALASVVVLVPALLVRAAYTDSTLARVLVTLCVIAYVIPYVIPQGGDIPLIGLVKGLLDGGAALGGGRIKIIIELARLALVVLTLLVWMPGPASAGGTVFAWVVILGIGFAVSLLDTVEAFVVLGSSSLEIEKHTPAMATSWLVPTACLVFVGYGLATVIGKQLE